MRPEVEDELIEYLRLQKEADVSATLKRIVDWTQEHTAEDRLAREEMKGVVRGHSLRIGALEKNDDRLDDKLSKSGSWNLEQTQADALVAQKTADTWRDRFVTIVVGLVMLLVGGACTAAFNALQHK